MEIVDRLMELAIGNGGTLNENVVDVLLQEGYKEDSVSKALVFMRILVLHKSILENDVVARPFSIRYFSHDEEIFLGSEICECLQVLQFSKFLTPLEVDFLVFSYMRVGHEFLVSDDDFFSFLRAFRVEGWEYLTITKRLKSITPAVLH